MSGAIDAYLVLLHDGVVVDSNDDGGEGQNARILAVLPETGTYTAVVSAFGSEGSGGRYALQLTALTGPPPAPGQTGSIALGTRVVGRLEPGDQTRADGGYQDFWEAEARGGEDVIVELRSAAFDTYLELYGPDGKLLAQDDDGLGDGTNSLITAHLARGGRYRLVVRSYSEKEGTGLYELALLSAGPIARPGVVTEIRAGTTVVGRLEPGDSTVGDSTYADVFLFRPRTSGEAVIDLRSADFDAYLILQDAAGRTLMTDDDSGSGSDARISLRRDRGTDLSHRGQQLRGLAGHRHLSALGADRTARGWHAPLTSRGPGSALVHLVHGRAVHRTAPASPEHQ